VKRVAANAFSGMGMKMAKRWSIQLILIPASGVAWVSGSWG